MDKHLFNLMDKLLLGTDTSINYKIFNNENFYEIYMILPGLIKKDINIYTEENYLIISSDKDTMFIDKFKKYFTLPNNIDVNFIEAKLENGILHINIPLEKKKKHKNLIEVK